LAFEWLRVSAPPPGHGLKQDGGGGRCSAAGGKEPVCSEMKFSVGTLALREKRSGTKLERDLAKYRRFSRALLENFNSVRVVLWHLNG